MDLLAFGKTGWGDELFYATLMTLAVSITAMIIGFVFALIFTPLKISNNKILNLIGNCYTTVIRGVPEFFRGAIQSIDKGQFEASKVLGFKKHVHFFKIILPQMLRLAIPNLSNVWQITLKDTSLISVTGLVEIMRQSYIAAGSTRDPLFFYSFAALLYLMLTYLSMKLINRLEIKYSKGY